MGRAVTGLVAGLPACFMYVLLAAVTPPVFAGTYVEDFGGLEYCDQARTTAWWDTVAGEIKLHPIEPGLVGTFQTLGAAYRVAVRGHYAYLAAWHQGLAVIDISNPSSPTFAGGYNTLGFARGCCRGRHNSLHRG